MWTGALIWKCTIGCREIGNLPSGADSPMRQAITKTYFELTGKLPEFVFSGWNGELTDAEMSVLDEDKK